MAIIEESIVEVPVEEVPITNVDDVYIMHTTDTNISDGERNIAKSAGMEDNVIKVSESVEMRSLSRMLPTTIREGLRLGERHGFGTLHV